jgi:HSP20 family protein
MDIEENMGLLMPTWPRFTYPLRKEIRYALCNLEETKDKVRARFELPGIPKKNISLNVGDDSIEIKGWKEKKQKGSHESMKFYRKISTPVPVITEKANASFKDGIVTVEVAKQKSRTKEIPVR